MSHYEILQVTRAATKDAIRRSYLAQAKKLHPDINPSASAKAQFQKIQEAYAVLSNDLSKKDYDNSLHASGSSSRSGNPSGSSGSSGPSWESQREAAAAQWRRNFRYSEYAGFPGGERGYARFNAQMSEEEARREYERQMDDMRRQQKHNFSQADFEYTELIDVMKKALPVFVPMIVILTAAMYAMTKKEKEKFKVVYDSDGNAFIEDAFGRVTRFQPYDRR
jgi:DnaJ-class molecular chaperone